jgi:hypothetical protein
LCGAAGDLGVNCNDEDFDIDQLDQFISGITDQSQQLDHMFLTADVKADSLTTDQQSQLATCYTSPPPDCDNFTSQATSAWSAQWLPSTTVSEITTSPSLTDSCIHSHNTDSRLVAPVTSVNYFQHQLVTSQPSCTSSGVNSSQDGLRVYSLADLLFHPADSNSQLVPDGSPALPQHSQLSVYPYTPPESGSEVNSPPSCTDPTSSNDGHDTQELIEELLYTQQLHRSLLSLSPQQLIQAGLQQAPPSTAQSPPSSSHSPPTGAYAPPLAVRSAWPVGQPNLHINHSAQVNGRPTGPHSQSATRPIAPANQSVASTVQPPLLTQPKVPSTSQLIGQPKMPVSESKRANTKQNNSRQPPSSTSSKENAVPIVQPNKKRKYSDSPAGSFKASRSFEASSQIKTEPVFLSDGSDDDTSVAGQFVQNIRWSNHQQNKWQTLLDKTGTALPALSYAVEADKGFSYLPHDESFVSQKKNHFQVTVHTGWSPAAAPPQFVLDTEGGVTNAVPIDGFYLHLHGVKMELSTYKIKIEQSLPDRSKHALHPVRFVLASLFIHWLHSWLHSFSFIVDA